MRGRRRNSSGQELRASPFVVLADMTIGLTFFFAVLSLLSSLANSQGIKAAQRTEKQTRVKSKILEAFQRVYPDTVSRKVTNSVGDEYLDLRSSSGKSIGQVWENGNFQRIMIYPGAFKEAGSVELSANGERLYMEIGKVLKPNVTSFGYLFVHGIVEPAEATATDEGKTSALELSRQRADGVSQLLVRQGLIAPTASTTAPGQVEKKLAISYGTGTELYTLDSPAAQNWGTKSKTGRVDLVLFYNDEFENRK